MRIGPKALVTYRCKARPRHGVDAARTNGGQGHVGERPAQSIEHPGQQHPAGTGRPAAEKATAAMPAASGQGLIAVAIPSISASAYDQDMRYKAEGGRRRGEGAEGLGTGGWKDGKPCRDWCLFLPSAFRPPPSAFGRLGDRAAEVLDEAGLVALEAGGLDEILPRRRPVARSRTNTTAGPTT